MTGFSLLTVPWGLALAGASSEKIPLSGPGILTMAPAGASPLLFAADDRAPWIDGRRDVAQIHASLTTDRNEPQRLHALPVPLQGGAPQLLRHEGWRGDAQIRWAGAVSRPRNPHLEGDEEEPGRPWFRFLLAVAGRMKDFEAALDESFLPWERVRERWLAPGEAQEPVMDVLVRHARRHGSRWAAIAQGPRRVLSRRREMVPLARVEELDTRCMAWLSRQPGDTIAERAGAGQRIQALARYENLNTLENRVFRDLLERSAAAARDYLRLNAGRRRSGPRGRAGRYAMVERYGRECRLLALELAAAGVGRGTGFPQPNFVLLQDERYRHVWEAWGEIVNRERVYDDLWRWQRRAWEEFCKAACTVALLARPGAELVAASPLFFRPEPARGEWLVHDDPLAIVHDREDGFVAEVLRGDGGDVRGSLRDLGAALWLRVADTRGGVPRYVAAWAVQGPADPPPLADLVESADRAFELFRAASRRSGREAPAAGVVLQALPDPDAEPRLERTRRIAGLAFGPGEGQLARGLDLLGEELSGLIGDALA